MSVIIRLLKDKYKSIINSIIALAIGFIGGIFAIYVAGFDVGEAMGMFWAHSIGNPFVDIYPLTVTLTYSAPLMLTGLAFALCARAGLFNIGVEGQLYMGALGIVLASSMLGLPTGLHSLVILGGAVLFALAWSSIPAILKVWRGTNEVVVTIMLNYIALWTADYIIFKFYADPSDATKSIPIPAYARLPLLVEGTSLSWNIVLSIGVVLLVYFFLWYTKFGYEMRVAGTNPMAARYAGINPRRAVISSFLIGGVLAGLAAYEKIAGIPPSYSVMSSMANVVGAGLDGIAVALVGANHPIGIIFASFLIGMLSAGAKGFNLIGIPKEVVYIFQGVIVMSLAVPNIYTLIKRKIKGVGGG